MAEHIHLQNCFVHRLGFQNHRFGADDVVFGFFVGRVGRVEHFVKRNFAQAALQFGFIFANLANQRIHTVVQRFF